MLRRVARKADGWFPSIGLEDGVEDAIARLREYLRREGRDPSSVGIEGPVSLDDAGPDNWVQQGMAWKKVGATHLAVYTDGRGFASLDQHIACLRLFQEAWSDV